MTWNMDKPIACDLNAIPDDQREAHIKLTEGLFAQVAERQALRLSRVVRLCTLVESESEVQT